MRIKCINEVMQWHYSSSITTHEQKKEIVGSIWKFLRSGPPFLSLAKFVLSFKNSIWTFWLYILTKRGKSSAEAFQMCLKFYIIYPLYLIYDLNLIYSINSLFWFMTCKVNTEKHMQIGNQLYYQTVDHPGDMSHGLPFQ